MFRRSVILVAIACANLVAMTTADVSAPERDSSGAARGGHVGQSRSPLGVASRTSAKMVSCHGRLVRRRSSA